MINLQEIWAAIEGRVVALIHKTEARGCRVINTSTQSVSSGVVTPLSFNYEQYDTDGCWAVGSPTKLFAQRDGYYMAGGGWGLLAVSAGGVRMSLAVMLDGNKYLAWTDFTSINGANGFLTISTGMFWMSQGSYVEICALHAFGTNKTIAAATVADPYPSYGWLQRVS